MSCTADRSIFKLFTIFIVLLCKFDSNSNSNSNSNRPLCPLIVINTVLSSSNRKRRLRFAIMRLLSWLVLAARSVATRLRNMAPVVENTRPLQVPFSICTQRSPYFLSFIVKIWQYFLYFLRSLGQNSKVETDNFINKEVISR